MGGSLGEAPVAFPEGTTDDRGTTIYRSGDPVTAADCRTTVGTLAGVVPLPGGLTIRPSQVVFQVGVFGGSNHRT